MGARNVVTYATIGRQRRPIHSGDPASPTFATEQSAARNMCAMDCARSGSAMPLFETRDETQPEAPAPVSKPTAPAEDI